MSYLYHPAAEVEHLESVAFNESRQPGLGAVYLAEFENVMKRVVRDDSDIRRIRMYLTSDF